jgi:hypothetical protein
MRWLSRSSEMTSDSALGTPADVVDRRLAIRRPDDRAILDMHIGGRLLGSCG